jgi:hypothetical protein
MEKSFATIKHTLAFHRIQANDIQLSLMELIKDMHNIRYHNISTMLKKSNRNIIRPGALFNFRAAEIIDATPKSATGSAHVPFGGACGEGLQYRVGESPHAQTKPWTAR